MTGLPEGPLVAYYGDDFTGSTDAMEVMAFAGLPTVLFVRPPSPAALARFSDRRGIGVAGIARSKPPEWMDRHLPPIYDQLFACAAPITQYKICSTFDSSSHVGSIGHAIDLALPRARESWSPMVVAAPQLRRWQAFGNLFAAFGSGRYRIDRHPTMARHPITPMTEGDLTCHLARQTARPVRLVALPDLAEGRGDEALGQARAQGSIVLFDLVDATDQAEVGRLIWENRGAGLFSASSSGLQYALVAHWRAAGLLTHDPPPLPPPRPVERLLVLSGSCSPVTAGQIAFARDAGFLALRLEAGRIADPARRQQEIETVLDQADAALGQGRDVLVFTAESPDDPAVAALADACAATGVAVTAVQEALGEALGTLARVLVQRHALRRVVVAGGDTAGRVIGALPIDALEAVAPLAPGSPVCRTHAEDPAWENLELVLKGGQVGDSRLFTLATGRPG